MVIDPVRGVRHQHLGMTGDVSRRDVAPREHRVVPGRVAPPPVAFLTTSEGMHLEPRMVHHVRKFASVGSSDAVSSTSALAFAAWAIAGRFGSVLRVS